MSDRASDNFLFPRMSVYFACSFMPKECKDYCVKGMFFIVAVFFEEHPDVWLSLPCVVSLCSRN